MAAFPGDTPRELNGTIEFCLEALRDMGRATFTLNRFVLFPGTPVANQPGEFGVTLDGAAGDMPSHYDYHLTPPLQADEAAVDALVAAGQERLFTELGWRNLGTGPGAEAAVSLYFDSGHGAVLKQREQDPFAPLLSSRAKEKP